MWKRFVALVAGVVTLCTIAVAAPPANAGDLSARCWSNGIKKWGVNCDGWNVWIDNQSDYSVWGWDQTAVWPYDQHDQFGISVAAGEILSKKMDTSIRGKDALGGPSNMFFVLGSGDINGS